MATKRKPNKVELGNKEIAYAKIFPPIGIARVGSSTEEDGYFVGPEDPANLAHHKEGFSFRDGRGELKRQAARFRVFGFSKDGRMLGEITNKEARIIWTVQLANKKSGWFQFDGAEKAIASITGDRDPTELRNSHLPGGFIPKPNGPLGKKYEPDPTRAKQGLDIVAPPVSIQGEKMSTKRSKSAKNDENFEFRGLFKNVKEVYLGELRTDEAGRLLVLGGHGISDAIDEKGNSIKDKRWIQNYANNLDWYDDIADGYVKAEVLFADGKALEVRGDAWVATAPPDYAPDVTNIVTLLDVIEDSIYATGRNSTTAEIPAVPLPTSTVFDRDIRPILKRMADYRWVNELALRGHGFGKPGDFERQMDDLGDPHNERLAPVRRHIVDLIRRPIYFVPGAVVAGIPATPETMNELAKSAENIAQATAKFMPPLSGDENDRTVGSPLTWLTVTHLQYARLQQWAEGSFTKTEAENSVEPHVRVTRAAWDAACGGAFYPGMELTSIVRHPGLFEPKDAFRARGESLDPGDLTKHMACPWQADFYECQNSWWPAQRPDDVLTEGELDEITASFHEETKGENTSELERLLMARRRWDRGIDWRRPGDEFLDDRVYGDLDPKDTSPNQLTMRTPGGAVSVLKSPAEYATNRAAAFARVLQAGVVDVEGFQYPERLPSLWRIQFLQQERLDEYSGRYFHASIPSPEEMLQGRHLSPQDEKKLAELLNGIDPNRLRNEWDAFVRAKPKAAVDVAKMYVRVCGKSLREQIHECFIHHPESGSKVRKFLNLIKADGGNIAGLENKHREEFAESDPAYKRLRLADLLRIMRDRYYLVNTRFAGDHGMIEEWHTLGIVAKKSVTLTPGGGEKESVPVQVEVGRNKFDGLTARDYFHLFMNIERNPGFAEYAKKLAQGFLDEAQTFVDEQGLEDTNHPESFVEYSNTNYNAKLEQIYEILRQGAERTRPWVTLATRASTIRGIVGNSAFNQTDGAWLRFAANAGPADEIKGLLFEVWSDETGNGDPAKHHGNLYTALVNELGFFPPEIGSRAYADSAQIDTSSFAGAIVQLAISQHSEEFFPEILGMTLFLEWEVLSLVPGVKRLEYLGINSHFFRMHVAIDNATEGHGAAAKRAVQLYLDHVFNEGGATAQQEQWRRIWRGFVTFALSGGNKNGGTFEEGLLRSYPGNAYGQVSEVITRKKPYGNLNHSRKQLGQFRINDLFDDPDIFLEELAQSKWIKAGDPGNSGLISHLTSFQGPMYKIFDEADLQKWRNWIVWLGAEGDTRSSRKFVPKGEAMLILLTELRERAMASHPHSRYRLDDGKKRRPQEKKPSIQDLFSLGDLTVLMKALKNPENGWVVPGQPDESALLVDMARADRPMGKALDERFPAAGNQIGRRIILEWIDAGCPIPGEAKPATDQLAKPRPPRPQRLIVQQFGLGAVH